MQDRPWTAIGTDSPVLPETRVWPGSGDSARPSGSAIRAWRVRPEAAALCWKARQALLEQAIDWDARPFLERQRTLLDFRLRTGKPVDEWLEVLGRLARELFSGPAGRVAPAPLDRLAAFYDHLGDLDCEPPREPAWRDPELRDGDHRAVDVRRLADLLEPVQAMLAR